MATKTEPFDIGDEVVVFAEFTDDADVATTPSEGLLTIEEPDGTQTETEFADLTNPAAGRLEHEFLITQSGTHYFRFQATQPLRLAREGAFHVRKSEIVGP